MAKNSPVAAPAAPAPVVPSQEDSQVLAAEALLGSLHPEVAEDNAKSGSVVRSAYKHRYANRAVAAGLSRKAAQRSSWDWLAQTLAGECLGEGDRISIAKFLAILDCNGIDHSRWQNRSKGWEGRLRMTGRLALQKVVAESTELRLPDGEVLTAPEEWVAKFAR
jgi:hypothetical protein